MSCRNVTIICIVATNISLASACSSSDVTPTGPTALPEKGSLQVTTATSGLAPDANGYSLRLDGSGLASAFIQMQPNGVATVSAVAGVFVPTLFDVAPNCDLVTPLPATLSIKVGSPTPVTLNISCATPTTLAFVKNQKKGTQDIYTVNSDGTGESLIPGQSGSNSDPAWSPDGRKLAFVSSRDGPSEIYVMDAAGGSLLRLTNTEQVGSTPFISYGPAWSPDGSRIAFVSVRDDLSEIYAMNSDGTNLVRLTTDGSRNVDPAWSPDGSRIAFASGRNGSNAIWVMNADGSAAKQLTSTRLVDSQPAWSPDGSKIAFSRQLPSSGEVYQAGIAVMNSDGSGLMVLTPALGYAADPSWSPDGSKIAFAAMGPGYFPGLGYDELNGNAFIAVVALNGVNGSVFSSSFNSAFHPAWRPR